MERSDGISAVRQASTNPQHVEGYRDKRREKSVGVSLTHTHRPEPSRMTVPESKPPSDYVVALRGSSAALFGPEQRLQITLRARSGLIQFTMTTRLVKSGFPDRVPSGLWVDARGKAESIEDAVNEFSNIANFLCSFFATTANAWVGDLQAELAYNATPGLKRREYFQQSLPEGGGTLQPARQGNSEATLALLAAVNAHPDSEMLRRAVVHYGSALRHWKYGHEVLAVAHLWMGMEALTPVVRHQACRQLQLPEELWRSSWRFVVEANESLKDNGIRRDILFQGDLQAYTDARKAMDGYEHGFMAFEAVRSQALAVRNATALYLRTAIVVLSGLDKVNSELLFGPAFLEPFDAIPISRYLRGTLIGETDELAAEGQAYPILHWRTRLAALSRTSDGQYKVRYKEKYVAELGKGVSFQAQSFEIWGPADAKRDREPGQGSTFEIQVDHNLENKLLTPQDHIRDVLEVLRSANISPSFTSEKLVSGALDAQVEVFEDQIRGWWLSKAYALDPDDDNSAHVVLPIAAAVMIRVERFRQGKPHKSSRALFRDAFQKTFHSAPESVGHTKRELQEIPDGILDWIEGGVSRRGTVLINERGPHTVRAIAVTSGNNTLEVIEINPKKFLDSVAGTFSAYVTRLRDSSDPRSGELRERFRATQDALHGHTDVRPYGLWGRIVGLVSRARAFVREE
jgi:hypothetical protein